MDGETDPQRVFDLMTSRIDALEGRVATLERQSVGAEATQLAPTRTIDPVPSAAPGSPLSPLPPPPQRPAGATPIPTMTPPVEPVIQPAGPMLGTEPVLKWVGSVLVFLAAVFFVSTAISRGWIGPELQLAGAVAVGLALLWSALRLLDPRPAWALALGHTGVAVLAASAVAGDVGLDLYGIPVALIATGAVAAASVAMAITTGRASIAATGAVATVLNPLIVGAPEAYSWWATAAWLLAVVVVFTVLGVQRRWASLRMIVFATTAIPLLALAGNIESSGSTVDLAVGLVVAAVAVATFVAGPILSLADGEGETDSLIRSLDSRLLVTVPTFAWLLFGLMTIDNDNRPFVLGLAVAGMSVLVAELLRRFTPMTQAMYLATIVGASIVATIGLIGLIDGPTLLIAIAAQAIGLGVLAWSVDDTLLRINAVALAVISIVWAGLSMLVAIVDGGTGIGEHLANLFVVAAVAVLAVTMRGRKPFGPTALLAYIGWLMWVLAALRDLSQGQVGVSIVWACTGAAVFLFGLTQDRRIAQLGLATLAVTVVKLVTVDLETVDTIWRAGLFFVVGLGLLRLGLGVGNSADTQSPPQQEIELGPETHTESETQAERS